MAQLAIEDFVNKNIRFYNDSKKPMINNMLVSVFTEKGHRPYMEDYYVVASVPHATCAVVFDGHGGDEVSLWLSKNYPRYLFEMLYRIAGLPPYFQLGIPVERIRVCLAALILYLDVMMINMGYKSGSTMTGVLVFQGTLYTINLGDSRTIELTTLTNQRAFFSSVSQDHVPQSQRERTRISHAGSFVSNNSSIPRLAGIFSVSRSMGDSILKLTPTGYYLGFRAPMSPEPDISSQPTNGHVIYVAMASDGLFEGDGVNNQQVLDHLMNQYEKDQSLRPIKVWDASRLVRQALQTSRDNTTLLLIRIDPNLNGYM